MTYTLLTNDARVYTSRASVIKALIEMGYIRNPGDFAHRMPPKGGKLTVIAHRHVLGGHLPSYQYTIVGGNHHNPHKKYRYVGGALRKQLGARLFAVAVAWSRSMPETQRERNAVIKAVKRRKAIINGSHTLTTAREAVETAATKLHSARTLRRPRSFKKRYDTSAAELGRRLQQPMQHRLATWRSQSVLRAYNSVLRTPTHGNVSVALTDSPDKVGIDVDSYKDWDIYRGDFKGWAANVNNIVITVPERWISRVLKTGLATADGMLTLDAAPLDGAPDGIRLYAATWAQQARGYDIRVCRGVIATDGIHFYHGTTTRKAIMGLRRKAGRVS
ncbi:MAG: hypothetical protein Q9M13_06245, partial [Mariprofundales bacterium]|nr:hypothetical protein [Mariprofundales bacterium]